MIENIICNNLINVIDALQRFIQASFLSNVFVNISSYIDDIIDISNYMQFHILPILYYFVPYRYFAPMIFVFSVVLALRITLAIINLIYP